jgi:hypothetical protein
VVAVFFHDKFQDSYPCATQAFFCLVASPLSLTKSLLVSLYTFPYFIRNSSLPSHAHPFHHRHWSLSHVNAKAKNPNDASLETATGIILFRCQFDMSHP